MADKSRSIQTKFWYDTWIETLSTSEKLLYLYLLTNPLTNLLGIYEISLKHICDESGLKKDIVLKGLKRFEKDSRVYFVNDNYIILPNFLKNQSLNTNMKRNVEKLFMVLPKSIKNNIIENGSESFERIRNSLVKYKIEIENEIKIKIENKDINNKHKYGEYNHVLLKSEELEKLKVKFQNWEWHIKNLDEAIQQHGYKYKDHYLTILKWAEKEGSQSKPKKKIIGSLYKCPCCDYEKTYKDEGSYECPKYPNKCEGYADVKIKGFDINIDGSRPPKMEFQNVVREK